MGIHHGRVAAVFALVVLSAAAVCATGPTHRGGGHNEKQPNYCGPERSVDDCKYYFITNDTHQLSEQDMLDGLHNALSQYAINKDRLRCVGYAPYTTTKQGTVAALAFNFTDREHHPGQKKMDMGKAARTAGELAAIVIAEIRKGAAGALSAFSFEYLVLGMRSDAPRKGGKDAVGLPIVNGSGGRFDADSALQWTVARHSTGGKRVDESVGHRTANISDVAQLIMGLGVNFPGYGLGGSTKHHDVLGSIGDKRSLNDSRLLNLTLEANSTRLTVALPVNESLRVADLDGRGESSPIAPRFNTTDTVLFNLYMQLVFFPWLTTTEAMVRQLGNITYNVSTVSGKGNVAKQQLGFWEAMGHAAGGFGVAAGTTAVIFAAVLWGRHSIVSGGYSKMGTGDSASTEGEEGPKRDFAKSVSQPTNRPLADKYPFL